MHTKTEEIINGKFSKVDSQWILIQMCQR